MAEHIVLETTNSCKEFVSETFGRLKTIGPKFMAPVGTKGKRRARQECICECGARVVVKVNSLRSGDTRSCGCLHKAQLTKRSTSHGMRKTPEYGSWCDMKKRCGNPKTSRYSDYGGRGVGYCERWKKFENFFADMGLKPTPQHTLERKDTNGNYEPDNCIWATDDEQANNKRNNHLITIGDRTDTLANWCRHYNTSYHTVKARINKLGWDPLRALAAPIRPRSLNHPKPNPVLD